MPKDQRHMYGDNLIGQSMT